MHQENRCSLLPLVQPTWSAHDSSVCNLPATRCPVRFVPNRRVFLRGIDARCLVALSMQTTVKRCVSATVFFILPRWITEPSEECTTIGFAELCALGSSVDGSPSLLVVMCCTGNVVSDTHIRVRATRDFDIRTGKHTFVRLKRFTHH